MRTVEVAVDQDSRTRQRRARERFGRLAPRDWKVVDRIDGEGRLVASEVTVYLEPYSGTIEYELDPEPRRGIRR